MVLIFAACGAALFSCGKEKKEEEKKVDCRTPLTAWYEKCGFSVAFNDVDAVSFDEAYQSCQQGYGKMWNLFDHCYFAAYKKNGDSCEAWAECVPEHGFITDDDDTTSPTDDDATPPTDDDTTPTDDDTPPTDDDTPPTDDDTTPVADDDTDLNVE